MKRELSLEEIKAIEFDILVDFDRICRGNGIKYSLAYGTLLGAIRHQGFIPWDDDIDIIMSRDEYEKFLPLWKSNKYKLLTSKKDCDFWPLFSRITDPKTTLDPPKICNHGIWVAVIPYDKIPDNEKECKKHLKRVKWYLKLFELRIRNPKINRSIKSIPKYLALQLINLIPPYLIAKKVEKIKTRYRNTNAKRVNPWRSKIIVDSSIFNDYIDVDFEGLKAMATKKYDYILRYEYGDYMQLPPENERVPKHGYKAFIDE